MQKKTVVGETQVQDRLLKRLYKLLVIASTARDARRERSELYGREYDQEKVTSTIYTSSRNFSDRFSSVFSSRKLVDMIMGLTNTRHEVTRHECQLVSRTYFADYSYYLLSIYIIFLYTDNHSLMML